MEYSALSGQYCVDKTIGCGGFAKVKLATHILTGDQVAIKIMRKESLMKDLPRVKHEINALKSLSHNNICKLYQVLETDTHYFLIMEYCCGGELFDHIVQKEKLTEDEARIFFQQIVSAVSYLHGQGFAHRDLKPENILLDKNHNLKLIDFGLSVKPENDFMDACKQDTKYILHQFNKGTKQFINDIHIWPFKHQSENEAGPNYDLNDAVAFLSWLEGHLYTSCGSPNYAAPELIRGEKYLGPEIDIWSLGVLLYALLCGTLPFEDFCIQKLFEKILRGYYEEKEWLSDESRALLNSLLQVNPSRRISTEKLKLHPWFKKCFEKSHSYHSLPKLVKDDEILSVMLKHFNLSSEDLWNDIIQQKYDYTMATYLLLLERKRNNEPVKLLSNKSDFKRKILGNSVKQINDKSCDIQETPIKEPTVLRTNTYVLRRDRDGIRGSARCNENRLSGRRNGKRFRSPGLEDKNGPDAKRMKEAKTPVSKKQTPQSNMTPCSAKKILVGLERSLNKAKSAFTSGRRNNLHNSSQPSILWGKDLCNVSSTTSKSPGEILAQLQKALKAKGIICTQKGFVLKGKLRQQSTDKKKGKDQDKLSFELEVCWIPSMSVTRTNRASDPLKEAVVGIRRKRLRGDAWIYKNVCEEVLALAAPLKKE